MYFRNTAAVEGKEEVGGMEASRGIGGIGDITTRAAIIGTVEVGGSETP
jgi:hypothetical protein